MDDQLRLLFLLIVDPTKPWPHRRALLRDVLNNTSGETDALAKEILDCLSAQAGAPLHQEKLAELNELLKAMHEGPLRQAIFVQMACPNGSQVPQALVLLEDGTPVYTVIPDADLARQLRAGDRVILDGKGRALLHRAPHGLKVGEVAQLERRIDDQHVEVTLRSGAERAVFFTAPGVLEQLQQGQLGPGASLIVNPRQTYVLAAIPPQDGLSHYRFLDRGSVPDVVADRDMGAPPRCLAEIARHLRTELTQPAVHRRYRIRRSLMKLLCGVSGTGKTLTVHAAHRQMYEIMSEVTGVPIGQLPPRVFKIRQGQVLSMWLGESEKNWERALTEAEQLANEPYTTPDGRQFKLPVMVVLEEVDGLGRARGHEAIYDRVLTTVLQRLDPARPELGDRLIVVLATTNEPHLVDPALLRRIGGSIEVFSRLNRAAFRAVLEKHVRALPAAAHNGDPQELIWRRHINDLTAWLFSVNGSEPGLVELVYAGSTTPVVKYRRDFLTGALVDRAVQQAAAEASQAELEGVQPAGVTFEQLTRAFDEQLRGIVDQLKEHNVGRYTDLPDGVRVATLRRIPQPAHLPFAFQRQ